MMMRLALAVALALAPLAVPHAAHAADDAAGAQTAVRFSLDTPIQELLADPAAKAVIDADLPGLSTHPSYEMFKGMSLRQVQPYSDGKLTDEVLAKVAADLAAIR